MPAAELFFLILLFVFAVCIFAAMCMVFYLGRNKVKSIDRLVYGFEIPSDSIFFQWQRVPHYGGAFASRWFAKRVGLLHIRDHFDKQFQRPFVITEYLLLIGGSLGILAVVLDKLFLHVT